MSRHLKEELGRAIDKRLQFIIYATKELKKKAVFKLKPVLYVLLSNHVKCDCGISTLIFFDCGTVLLRICGMFVICTVLLMIVHGKAFCSARFLDVIICM